MKLNEYLSRLTKKERAAEKKRLAEELGLCKSMISSMANGTRPIREKYAPLLEQATNGMIRREEIAPHMYKK